MGDLNCEKLKQSIDLPVSLVFLLLYKIQIVKLAHLGRKASAFFGSLDLFLGLRNLFLQISPCCINRLNFFLFYFPFPLVNSTSFKQKLDQSLNSTQVALCLLPKKLLGYDKCLVYDGPNLFLNFFEVLG